jgi:radical SAM protein (TIGR01212 family)
MDWMTKDKPYNALNRYLRDRYGTKVFKVPLDGGFTCPNKDGTAGLGGCTFCTPSGSGDFAGDKTQPLSKQFDQVRALLHEKWPDASYLAYFQANTNTYGPVDHLKDLYDTALSLDPNIVGLSIATRPDALGDEVIDLLASYRERTDLYVELGLQTIHQDTADAINRGHDLACFTDAVRRLRARDIDVVVHIINGLPGETKDDMLATLDYVNSLGIQGIKIHLLHLMKKTAMGIAYERNPWPLLTREEYVDIVVDQIERLDPSVVVHRLTGDAPPDLLIAPLWSKKKFVVMNEIDKELRRRHTHQGIHYKGPR